MRKVQIQKDWKRLFTVFSIGVLLFTTAIIVLNFRGEACLIIGILMLIGGFVLAGGAGQTIIEYYFILRRKRKENEFTSSLFGELTETLKPETISRIIPVDILDNFALNTIEKGIISVHSIGNQDSINEGQFILKTLEKSKNQELLIFIIPMDKIPEEMQKEKLGFKSQGYFESVFVLNGKITCPWQGDSIKIARNNFRNFLLKELEETD